MSWKVVGAGVDGLRGRLTRCSGCCASPRCSNQRRPVRRVRHRPGVRDLARKPARRRPRARRRPGHVGVDGVAVPDRARARPPLAVPAGPAPPDGARQSGKTVLVNGAAGGVEDLALQLAKWKGARVVAVASGAHEDFLRELGADEFIDYTKDRAIRRIRRSRPRPRPWTTWEGRTSRRFLPTLQARRGPLPGLLRRVRRRGERESSGSTVTATQVRRERRAGSPELEDGCTKKDTIRVAIDSTFSLEDAPSSAQASYTRDTCGARSCSPSTRGREAARYRASAARSSRETTMPMISHRHRGQAVVQDHPQRRFRGGEQGCSSPSVRMKSARRGRQAVAAPVAGIGEWRRPAPHR